jgi:uncharacterized membrane protein YcaP (DUF421 family)
MGDFVQQAVAQSDYSLTGATIVIVTLGLLTVATAWLSFASSACGRCSRASRS